VLNVLQGSVATHVRHEQIFNNDFVTNLLPSLTVNNLKI